MNLPLLILATSLFAVDAPPPPPADYAYAPPEHRTAADAPKIFNFTRDAGPDESFLLVGQGLTADLSAWVAHPDSPQGREIKLKTQLASDSMVIATIPERAFDGPIIVWAKNKAGYSEPVILNAPEAWWCSPQTVEPGQTVHIFGRNLSRRPDFARAFVSLSQPGKPATWLQTPVSGKYRVTATIPADTPPGDYQLWIHAGKGGAYGWSEPLTITIRPPRPATPPKTFEKGNLQTAVDQLFAAGGGVLKLPPGVFALEGTLTIPANVIVEGAGRNQTILQSPIDPAVRLATVSGSKWNQSPTAIHTPGDKMTYRVRFPSAGKWNVFLRYATDMSPWNKPGMSGNSTLSIDGGAAVTLENLPNTGSFGTFKWSKAAEMTIPAGEHELVWTNVKGGGLGLDAFVFALDDGYLPSDQPFPVDSERIVVQQAEDVVRFETKSGSLPGGDHPVVWLAGDGAALCHLTLCGTPRTNIAIAVRSPKYPQWIANCRVHDVLARDHEGKQAENCGIRLWNADAPSITDSELWGRAPLFFSGVRDGVFTGNRLVSVTLWGGNAESYILSRNDVVRRRIVENNVCACPPGAQAGGPTGRRILWFSVGRGSVDHNWIAENREDRARFGGVAGTDQNVGEMILFEACERIAYYGKAAAGGPSSVTLPEKLSPTPDALLGSVQRSQLAHNAAGDETPFWPGDVDQGTPEPIASEYDVTILSGVGFGQTRRVVARQGATYQLDRPWRVAPDASSTILVHTSFRRNHIIDNRTVDGMTGVQLWIACIDNIVSGNTIARMRKPGVFLYGNCTTLASSMPCSWNRGIGPLCFNQIEGNSCDETSCGLLLTSGERGLPVQFPRCLGNLLRHNSAVRNRTDGVLITGNRPPDEPNPSPAIAGTIVEFNSVRDAETGYHVAQSAMHTLLRRNLAWFWYPVSLKPAPRVAFQIDNEKATAVLEHNSEEGINGVPDKSVIPEHRGK